MKKFLAAICAAALLITGCGDDSAETNENATNTAQASPVAQVVPIFKAKTITGENVTNKIFAAKKITVVNIWGTFCPPCIAEMPELGEMARSISEDAQVIGLVCDTSEGATAQIQEALQITKEAKVNFVNIVPDAALMSFMENVEAVPTTIFVNSKGEVVGKAIIGADVRRYEEELERLLDE